MLLNIILMIIIFLMNYTKKIPKFVIKKPGNFIDIRIK